jgi:transposase
MPALPSSILEPLWVQVSALLPARQVHHPLGCHRPRIPDRIVFDKLIQILVFCCSYRRIADATCSATTLRRRGMNGSAPASPSNCAVQCLAPTTGCSAWNWSTWPSTAASPRRPVGGRSPGQVRWIVASRG